jgi:carboxymethylenebutenolidase
MGELIEFPSNGSTGTGWLARPASGEGPGVIVIQEWWGLVDHIKDVCERFAREGFVALAPDLYRGKVAREPDEAGKLMMSLALDQAAKDLSGAVDALSERSSRPGVGVVGYCMGGGLALVLACKRPDKVKAVVPYYGVIAWSDLEPDYSAMEAAVQGHYAELDEWAGPEKARELESRLRSLGKQAEFFVYPGTEHAFFNDTRPEVYDPNASAEAWQRTVAFLRSQLS